MERRFLVLVLWLPRGGSFRDKMLVDRSKKKKKEEKYKAAAHGALPSPAWLQVCKYSFSGKLRRYYEDHQPELVIKRWPWSLPHNVRPGRSVVQRSYRLWRMNVRCLDTSLSEYNSTLANEYLLYIFLRETNAALLDCTNILSKISDSKFPAEPYLHEEKKRLESLRQN